MLADSHSSGSDDRARPAPATRPLLDAWLPADLLLLLRVRRGAAPAAAPAPAPAPAPAGEPRRPCEPCAARKGFKGLPRLLNAEGSALREDSRPPTCAAHRAA